MKILATTALAITIALLVPAGAIGQTSCTGLGGYGTNGNEIPCGDANYPCCTVWDACNGPYSGCNNFDHDFAPTGCDLSCTPIDSGVLFLLLGGAAFGGMMIMRRRQEALEVVQH